MSCSSRACALVLLSFASCQLLGTAHAQPSHETKVAAARQLGQAGVELYMSGDTAGAVDKLGRAYSVYPAPTLGLWYGRALERAGRLVEASERYREVSGATLSADATQAFRQAQADARSALETVTPRIAQLTIEVPTLDLSHLRVTLDGEELPTALLGIPIPVNPGEHVLKAAAGARLSEQALTLKEGQPLAAKITFPKVSLRPSELGTRDQANAPRAGQTGAALTRTQLVSVMHRAQPELNRCANGHAGGAVVSLVIHGAGGQVESANVKLHEQVVEQLTAERTPELAEQYASCMASVIERARFPSFEQPTLEVDYVFRFTAAR